MADPINRLVERLQGEGEKTLAFFRQLQPDDWSKQVYTEGACWTVEDVLVHFVSSENGVYRLLVNILDGGEGVPEDFDLDGYNERKVDQHKSASRAALFTDFWNLRTRTISLVSHLTAEDLEKTGRHPFLGLARVEDIVKLMYRHNQIHQREVRRQLS